MSNRDTTEMSTTASRWVRLGQEQLTHATPGTKTMVRRGYAGARAANHQPLAVRTVAGPSIGGCIVTKQYERG